MAAADMTVRARHDRMTGAQRVPEWMDSPRHRNVALHVVKGAHTVVFLALGAGVLETLRAGICQRPSRATGLAIVATFGEGVVLLASGNRCPLTGLAEELGAADGRVSDIFLPAWFARRIPSIFATLFGFGLGRLIEAQARGDDRYAVRRQTDASSPKMTGMT